MNEKVKAFIEENRLIGQGDAVIVALSGGADSVTLLHIFNSLKEEYNLDLQAAHLNHGIRGEEAQRDEDFVRSLCAALEIPLHVRREDIPALARERGKSEELCGREARYAFFAQLSAEYGAKIATAHNRDDLAETVLWNLIRGAGLGGLCGIPVRRGNIIRPLLSCSRREIEAYCAENRLSYVTDSTNLEPLYTRNRIRLEILPLLKELNENADGNIARTAALAREADGYFKNISDEESKRCRIAGGYDCGRLLELPDAVRSYALRQIAEEAGAPLDHAHTALVTQAMRGGGAVSLGGGITAVCAQGILRFIGDDAEKNTEVCVPLRAYPRAVRLQIKGGEIFCGGKPLPCQKIHKLFVNSLIPCDIITDDTVVRTRREGDTFTDSRRGVTKSLKKLFNELKIPREKRASVLLVADGSRVLWIEGVGSAVRVDLSRDTEAYFIDNGQLTAEFSGGEKASPANKTEGEHHA